MDTNEKAQSGPADNHIYLKEPDRSDAELLQEMSQRFRDKIRECNKLKQDLAKSQEKCKAYEGALERIKVLPNIDYSGFKTIGKARKIAEQVLKPKEDEK